MEQKPKLYLSMIIKDDEPIAIVKRSLDSVKAFVDAVYVAVTYTKVQPSDSPLLTFLQEEKVHLSFFQWIDDFAAARNFAINQVPKGSDCFIYWHDADDIVDKPALLPQIASEMYANNVAAYFFPYLYMVELDKEGNIREILVEHKRERLIRNDDTFKWIGELHETLIEQRQENVQKYMRPDISVIHLSDDKRIMTNLERNIRILEKKLKKEEHRDPRTVIYLAKAYFDKGKGLEDRNERKMWIDLSLVLFREYLEGEGKPGTKEYREGSGWAEERSTAWAYVADIFRMYNKLDQAIEAINYAIDEAPQFPSYYVDKAALYVMKQDISRAQHWLLLATNVKEPETTIVTMPRDLKVKALEVDYHVALASQKLEKAQQDLELLLSILPGNVAFEERLAQVKKLIMANRASQSIVFLGKYLEETKEEEKVPYLIRAIPKDLEVEKFSSEMRHRFMQPRLWEKNEIAMLCGPGWETWSPKSIATGLGGSEEAIVYMSQELTKLGWKVTVYANPAEHSGEYDGVVYKQWYDLNPKDHFNILFLWRAVGFVDVSPKAKYSVLWMHDIPNNPDFTQERIEKINKIAVLSDYHKSLFRMQKKDGSFVKIPDEKFFRTANGISLQDPKDWNGDSHKMIYASSPDRGLIYLLNNWKTIKEAVPDATLDIYYGFAIFDRIFANNPGRMAWKQQMMQLMEQDGITYHGRVGHKELEDAFAKAGIYAYPSDFQEISCISLMKAQALGAVPVVTNYAALKETVQNGVKVDCDITTSEGQKIYIQALIDMLKNEEEQKEIRKTMVPWAREYFPWNKVAHDWDSLFTKEVKE